MASDLALAESIRLAAAASALFAGLAISAGLRSIVPRFRRGLPGAKRFYAAMVSASVAVAAGTWAFISAARRGAAPGLLVWYAVAALAFGLLAGLFPRAAGIPSVAVAALLAGVAVAGLAPWTAWTHGSEAARLVAYSVTETGAMVTVTIAGPRGTPVERELELPPGLVELEFEVVELRGPLALAFGERRFQATAVIANGSRMPIGGHGEPLLFAGSGDPLARFLGCEAVTVRTVAFVPEFLAAASFVMSPGGGISLSGL